MRVLTCKTCSDRKLETDFYRCDTARTGRFSSCKECVKERVSKYRQDNIDAIRAYDRERGQSPERKAANRERSSRYVRSPRKWRDSNPEKWAAHVAVNNALRSGALSKPPRCEACSRMAPLEGHHDDYSAPLTVRWLCRQCHGAHHRAMNEWARQSAKVAAE